MSSTVTSFTMQDPALVDALNRAARERKMSRSAYIRELLATVLDVETTHVPYTRSQTSD